MLHIPHKAVNQWLTSPASHATKITVCLGMIEPLKDYQSICTYLLDEAIHQRNEVYYIAVITVMSSYPTAQVSITQKQ